MKYYLTILIVFLLSFSLQGKAFLKTKKSDTTLTVTKVFERSLSGRVFENITKTKKISFETSEIARSYFPIPDSLLMDRKTGERAVAVMNGTENGPIEMNLDTVMGIYWKPWQVPTRFYREYAWKDSVWVKENKSAPIIGTYASDFRAHVFFLPFIGLIICGGYSMGKKIKKPIQSFIISSVFMSLIFATILISPWIEYLSLKWLEVWIFYMIVIFGGCFVLRGGIIIAVRLIRKKRVAGVA